jgi:hypothetical protein
MPSERARTLSVAAIQYAVGVALLPLEPQYGLLVIGHHHVFGRLRPMTPGERLYLTAAIAIHTVGVTYPEHLYRAFAWYDNVTHFMSGSLVGGLVAVVLSRRIERFPWLLASTVVALVLVGVGWEMYEYHTPRLRVYGWGDTVSDIWTNVAGGLAMVAYLRIRPLIGSDDAGAGSPDPTNDRGLG